MDAIPVEFIERHIAKLAEESRDKTKSLDWRYKRLFMIFGMQKLLNYWDLEKKGKTQ